MQRLKADLKLAGHTFFPALQVGLLGLSCLLVEENPLWAVFFLLGSAVALNFTIHLSVHEFLHHSDVHPFSTVTNLLLSIVSGVTFDGYRLHHHNHHRHNNGPHDYSRTWKETPGGAAPVGLWTYAFGWPAQAARAGRKLRAASLVGTAKAARDRMRLEKWSILLAVAVLIILSWKYAALYIGMVYLGWVCVSIHNYGQHPPHLSRTAASYPPRWYNVLLFNNGLHFEHHRTPSKAWHELTPDPEAERIRAPHFIAPFGGGAGP